MFIKDKELHIVWCVEDVLQQAKENGYDLTEDEALSVLNLMLKRHDCNFGTTWESVDGAIKNYY